MQKNIPKLNRRGRRKNTPNSETLGLNREMTFAIANTDLDWFDTLKRESLGEVVNFWTPTPWNISGLQRGDPLYFMLKSPVRKIGGYGLFFEYRNMKASEAWRRYGLSNGVYDFEELVERTQAYAEKNSQTFTPNRDPDIGCIILSDPVVFDDDDFFKPEDYGFEFAKQVVKIKYFEAGEIPHYQSSINVAADYELIDVKEGRKKHSYIKDRVGQPAFRRAVLRAYKNRCAVTKSKVVEVLQAAHIQPYVDARSNHVKNGICLRADLHRLFDEGMIAINDDFSIEVCTRLKKASPAYGELDGRKIRLPIGEEERPSQVALKFHRSNIFVG